MAAIMRLTTGVVYVRGVTGQLVVGNGTSTFLDIRQGSVADPIATRISRSDTQYITFQTDPGGNAIYGIGGGKLFVISNKENNNLIFGCNNSSQWELLAPTGHFVAVTDNTVDIGQSGANRPKNLYLASSIKQVGGITTAGTVGVDTVVAQARTGTVTNAGTASIATVTAPAVDTVYRISADVSVTTSTNHTFSIDCVYTDVTNTSRTMLIPMEQLLTGNFITGALITNTLGVGPYESAVMQITVKASTSVTIRTSAGGTFTGVVYTAGGVITQVG